MTFKPSAIVTKDDIIAATQQFEFSAYVDEHNWHDDGHDLYRLVSKLHGCISRAAPVLQPSREDEADTLGITPEEYEYSTNFWRVWHLSPIIDTIRTKNWSLRRCHIEMVDMLRALISLDSELLREFDVVDITEIASNVELGQLAAADVVATELTRLEANETEGNMFRYGMFLGLHLAGVGKENRETLRRLLGDLGVRDGMERPKYPRRKKTGTNDADTPAREANTARKKR
jgi:hypothetical protein